jgi:galactokinase
MTEVAGGGFAQRSAERAVLSAFRRAFGDEPACAARAPARCVLLGEHTLAHDGVALVVALDREVRIAARATDGTRVRLAAAGLAERFEFDAAEPDPARAPEWAAPVVAAAASLRAAGHALRGFDGAWASSVPAGLGLGARTASAVAAAALWRAIAELGLDDVALAAACVAGAGGADVWALAVAALAARAGHAVWVDARDASVRAVPVPATLRFVVLDGGTPWPDRARVEAERRSDCERALAALRQHDPEMTSLREVAPEEIGRWADRWPEAWSRRLRHVVGEVERARLAAAALEQNETERFGELVFASHRSLREDYEATTPDADLLVELARGAPGVVGARALASASRAATWNAVAAAWVDEFVERVEHRYRERTGRRVDAVVSPPAAGASVERVGGA